MKMHSYIFSKAVLFLACLHLSSTYCEAGWVLNVHCNPNPLVNSSYQLYSVIQFSNQIGYSSWSDKYTTDMQFSGDITAACATGQQIQIYRGGLLVGSAYFKVGYNSPVNTTITDLPGPTPTPTPTTRIISLSGNLIFGNVPINSATTSTMTIRNTGNSALTVSGITYPFGFTGDWSSGTLAPGSSQDVIVTFIPTLNQAYGGTVTITSNKTSGANTIAASGLATTPPTPYSSWLGIKFTTADIATGKTTMTKNFDGDGLANLLEYAFSTDPKDINPSPVTGVVSGNTLQISFPCDATRTDITYTVQASSGSDPNSWTDIAQSAGGATTLPVGYLSTVNDSGTDLRTVTVTESRTLPAGGRFLRIKVTAP